MRWRANCWQQKCRRTLVAWHSISRLASGPSAYHIRPLATEWCDTGHGLSNGLHLEKHTAVVLFSWFLVLFCYVCMLRDLGTLVDSVVNAAVSTATSFVTFMLMHNKYGTDYSLYFIYWTLLRGRLGSLAAHSNRFDWIFDCVLKTIFLYYYMPQKENARSVLT